MNEERLDFVIVAGGRGRRFGGETPKQFLPLGNSRRTVLQLALERILSYPRIGRVVMTLPGDWMDIGFRKLIPTHLLNQVTHVVEGGIERQDSVRNGLSALMDMSPPSAWVAVHDAVRPLVTHPLIDSVWKAAQACGGGAVACGPMSDTLKRIGPTASILRTEDRAQFARAQTPQIFKTEILWKAHQMALRDGVLATDESALVEPLGYPIQAVVTGQSNPKITVLEDLLLAQALLDSE